MSPTSRITVLLVIGIVLAPLAASTALQQGGDQIAPIPVADPTTMPLPPVPEVKHPAASREVIEQTYEFAGRHPQVLKYIPCFCICGQANGHRSSEDCFVAVRTPQSVQWTPHAAECPICLAVARDARSEYAKGKTVREIREYIDKEYGTKFPNRTATPMPPARLIR